VRGDKIKHDGLKNSMWLCASLAVRTDLVGAFVACIRNDQC
jgi:hypothetical protein